MSASALCGCGSPLPPPSKYRPSTYCGECRKRRKREYGQGKPWGKTQKVNCALCGLKFNRSSVSAETTCSPCRNGYEPEHGVENTYSRGCRCEPCCAVGRAAAKVRAQRRPPRTPKSGRVECSCIVCGAEFVAWPGAKYCGKDCRGWETGHGKRPKGDYRRRARHFGVEYQKFDRRLIFKRDGYICGICDEAVDRELPYPHRMSVSLDHIVPMSKGGGHVPENVQCAHWICNVKKRDRLMESPDVVGSAAVRVHALR